MDRELAARLDAIEARFDRERALVAGQFEAMQQAADERHERLLLALQDRFDFMDRRFAELSASVDQRFDLVDQRFDLVDQRFAVVDQRFAELSASIDRRFDLVDRRFAAVDQRFDELSAAMDERFARERALITGQFEAMQEAADRRHTQLLEALQDILSDRRSR